MNLIKSPNRRKRKFPAPGARIMSILAANNHKLHLDQLVAETKLSPPQMVEAIAMLRKHGLVDVHRNDDGFLVTSWRARRHGRRPLELVGVPPELAAQAVGYVGQYRVEHGRGPTWGEVGRALGLDTRMRADVLHTLCHDGRLCGEGVQYGLNVPSEPGKESNAR